MSGQTSLFARGVALVGEAAVAWRRRTQGPAPAQAVGGAPLIPPARPQGAVPTLKMPTARGWAPGQLPAAAPGLAVNAFATGLKHPRWIHVLPNGDVTVAEALFMPAPPKTVFQHAMVATMQRAFPAGHFDLAAGRFLLGDALAKSGRTAEARTLLQAALDWRLEHLGAADPRTEAARKALARAPS